MYKINTIFCNTKPNYKIFHLLTLIIDSAKDYITKYVIVAYSENSHCKINSILKLP